MPEMETDLVRHALQVARNRGFAEVEIEYGDGRFAAHLDPVARRKKGSSAAPSEPAQPELRPIRSTLVGYFREGKTPLQVGASVAKGDTVGSISALGIANDVESKESGEVVEVLVQDGEPVEFGQPIAMMRVQP
jgi:acetyl-CoA carboxylase biotin carboxyl carrier protein